MSEHSGQHLCTDRAEPHVLIAYSSFLQQEPTSVCAAAIKALTEDIRRSEATTMMGLRNELRQAGEALRGRPDAPISIASLCELFVRFVTRTALDVSDFDACKRLLIERGEMFANTAQTARTTVAQLGAPFVPAGGVVLTMGYSRMVSGVLTAAATSHHFSVIVAESHPHGGGHAMAAELAAAGVPVTMIEDAAVACTMSRCQMVLCGAEAVVESGGIISRTGAAVVERAKGGEGPMAVKSRLRAPIRARVRRACACTCTHVLSRRRLRRSRRPRLP
eukprot:6193849-Pleurochrysis_carterae.AAC.1